MKTQLTTPTYLTYCKKTYYVAGIDRDEDFEHTVILRAVYGDAEITLHEDSPEWAHISVAAHQDNTEVRLY